ncbi:MAG TPA: penicillin-binding protein 2 [bacterium]|nr:penicillin-binding protein 2 [bacterium]
MKLPGFRKREARLQLVVWVYLIFALVIIFKLGILQIKHGARYRLEAQKSHFLKDEIPAPRGYIYDRNGQPLAISIPTYSLYAEPRYLALTDTPLEVARKLAPVLEMPVDQLNAILSSGKGFAWIQRRLPYETYAKIRDLGLSGKIGFEEHYERSYPEGRLACHIIGTTNLDGQGIEGLEKEYDRYLTGRKGNYEVFRDGRGRRLPWEYSSQPAIPGRNLHLTIDLRLQRILEEEIDVIQQKHTPRGIMAIILDADTGEVLALTNRPNYDPNRPAPALEPRRNRAITDINEPGSVFKMITAAGVLEEGAVKPSDRFFCENGAWRVPGRSNPVHDAHPYGSLTFREIIVKSSNIGTSKAALKMGKERMHHYAASFGFGKRTGIDLPGEVRGILHPLANWSGVSLYAIPYGQEVAATAIQSTAAMAAICNGGTLNRPYLVSRISTREGKTVEKFQPKAVRRIISEKTCGILLPILSEVTSEEGTARWADIPGYLVGGKTGTGQKVEGGHYVKKYFSSFIGFINTGQKKFAVFIGADEPHNGYYGGVVAGPAFNRIGQRALITLNIPPDQAEVDTAPFLPKTGPKR